MNLLRSVGRKTWERKVESQFLFTNIVNILFYIHFKEKVEHCTCEKFALYFYFSEISFVKGMDSRLSNALSRVLLGYLVLELPLVLFSIRKVVTNEREK